MPNETVAVPTTPEGVLCRAAEVIEERGWTTGSYVDSAGQVCLLGACMVATGGDPAAIVAGDFDLYLAAKNLVELRLNAHPPHWNDHVCRSKDEAVSVLRAAAGGCKEAPGAA